MSSEAVRQVTAFLRDRVDEQLRTVVLVREDDFEVEYLSPDLQDEYTKAAYADVVDTFRCQRLGESTPVDSHPVGERRVIIHYHENAFVFQFPVSDAESILVSLSPDTGRELLSFIEQCRERVTDPE